MGERASTGSDSTDELLRGPGAPRATRSPHRSSGRPSRCCIAGADLLGQAATGTGKTAAFALPILQRHRQGRPADPDRARARADPRARRAGQRGALQLRPRARREGAADLRRPAHRSSAPGAPPRRARGGRHPGPCHRPHQPRVAGARRRSARSCSTRPTRCSTWASPTTSSRSSSARPTDRQTVLFSATMPRRIVSIAKRHQRDPVRIEIGKATDRRRARRSCARRCTSCDRAHKASALGRVLDIEAPDGRHRVLPHSHRGRSAHRHHERSRLPRRGAARRHGPEPARSRDGAAARRHRRAAGRHRRRGPRARRRPAHPRRQLRRARRRRRATCTASVASAAPAARASPSPWPSRASDGCSTNIERLIKQPIATAKVPTVADLRTKQIELTVESLNEALASDDLDDYQGVLHALAGEDSRTGRARRDQAGARGPRRRARGA